MRIGVIARDDSAAAWRVAHARFADDREGQFTYALAAKSSDFRCFRGLSNVGSDGPYWTGPLRNSQSFCPYLVGGYTEVGQEIGRYIVQGNHVFILDVPASAEDLERTAREFDHARRVRRTTTR